MITGQAALNTNLIRLHRKTGFAHACFLSSSLLLESSQNPFKFLEKTIEINGEVFHYFDIGHFDQISKLPFSIRVLLESALRNCDNFHVKESDVTTILNWAECKGQGVDDEKEYEIPFKPSRVILQDFTGVPAGN